MQSHLIRLTAVVSFLLLAWQTAIAAPIYRETFQFCPRSKTGSLDAQQLVGWSALRKGKVVGVGGFLKSSQPGSPNNQLKAFRSFPVGRDNGNVLWTKTSDGLTLFSDEFSFDISSITTITYEQRFDGLSDNNIRDGSRLALLLGNTWYISDKVFNVTKRSVWESVSLTLAGSTWGTSVVAEGVGPLPPANSGLSLPTNGSVRAFGVFVTYVNDRVRIDNYTLLDGQPEGFYGSGEDGDLSQCPDLTSQQTPVTTPNTPVATGTPDSSETPVATEKTPIPTPAPKQNTFCSEAQLTTLGGLNRTTSKLKKAVVTGLPGRTLKGLRDRALLALMIFANPRVDLLTNVIVADYDRAAGLLKLPASVRPDGFIGTVSSTIDIKLNKFAKKHMQAYLKRYLRDGITTKILFPRVDRGTEKLISTSLCSKQFKRLLRLRAQREGIRIKFNLVPLS